MSPLRRDVSRAGGIVRRASDRASLVHQLRDPGQLWWSAPAHDVSPRCEHPGTVPEKSEETLPLRRRQRAPPDVTPVCHAVLLTNLRDSGRRVLQACLVAADVRRRWEPIVNAFSDARPGRLRASELWREIGVVRPPLAVPSELVRQGREAVTDCLSFNEAHRCLDAEPAEEALAGAEHDRENHQSQLVHQVVLD